MAKQTTDYTNDPSRPISAIPQGLALQLETPATLAGKISKTETGGSFHVSLNDGELHISTGIQDHRQVTNKTHMLFVNQKVIIDQHTGAFVQVKAGILTKEQILRKNADKVEKAAGRVAKYRYQISNAATLKLSDSAITRAMDKEALDYEFLLKMLGNDAQVEEVITDAFDRYANKQAAEAERLMEAAKALHEAQKRQLEALRG